MVSAAPVTFDGPLDASNASIVSALRAVLDGHGFTGTGAIDALGPPLPFGKSHLRDDLPFYLRRLEAPTPINTLVKLFMLDRTVGAPEAAAALAPLTLDAVGALGLIEHDPRGIRARLRLSMHDGLLLAHDAYDEETRTLRVDHVLDVNPTTISLSHLTVRRQVGRALEIGTGCGALALRASRHADRVIGTDTNPRALNVAAFNAAINGVTNVEWRLGSVFEAVAGETFDLIFCNPPYVISPDSQFIFRDGGRRGDALCEEIVRSAPGYLNEGGFATFLVNWVIRQGEEWAAPLQRWVRDNNCDAWLMMSAAQDPATYAGIWTRSRDRGAYTAALDRWMRYFQELEAAVIGLGSVVLRKRAGGGWVRANHIPENVTAPAGPHIERLFAAQDRLTALTTDQALLDAVFTVVPDHQLQQRLRLDGGRYVVDSAQVALDDGLPFHGSVDLYATQLLAGCDGQRPLRAVAEEIAAAAHVDIAAFTAASAGIARRLVAMGFLT